MENLFQKLMENPILMTVAVILVVVGAFTLVKHLWKLAIFIFLVLVGYISYLTITEQELPEELQKGQELINEITDMEKND